MNDFNFMQRAIELAKKGIGYTAPNPVVGAVVVKNGNIIGEGWHQQAGGLHAERNALLSCTESPQGATLYVTLEPCCHFGRTPPCTQAILEAGISHVYIGSPDPNPLLAGKGVEILTQGGVQVTTDFLRAACDGLNPVFFHYITQKMPYVALKYAMTADGKIATTTGASQWISGEVSRTHAHGLRHRYGGILVGIGTVLADDPLLTCRIDGGRQPLRIVCDSHLRISPTCRLCQTAKETPTVVAFAKSNPTKERQLEALGVTLWHLPDEKGRVSLPKLMARLAQAGIDSVLAEGGGEIHYSLLERQLAQRLYVYLAPKIFGGKTAKTPVGGAGVFLPDHAFSLRLCHQEVLDEDILLEYEILPKGGQPCSQD